MIIMIVFRMLFFVIMFCVIIPMIVFCVLVPMIVFRVIIPMVMLRMVILMFVMIVLVIVVMITIIMDAVCVPYRFNRRHNQAVNDHACRCQNSYNNKRCMIVFSAPLPTNSMAADKSLTQFHAQFARNICTNHNL